MTSKDIIPALTTGTTSPLLLDLNRRFLTYDPRSGVDAGLQQNYLSQNFGGFYSLSWADLLLEDRVVILGEPGSGKSFEFVHQFQKLRADGKFCFLLALNDLTTNTASALISNAPLDRDMYARWIDNSETAYFFLDAKDETKIFGAESFKTALLNLANYLGADKSRVKIFVSSRVTTWQPEDTETFNQIFMPLAKTAPRFGFKNSSAEANSTDEAIEPKKPTLVTLKALNLDQIDALAKAKMENTDIFIRTLSESDYVPFATRPLDAELLISYWNEYRALPKTLSDAIEIFIKAKIEESNETLETANPLSEIAARGGASILALSNVLCKKKNFDLNSPAIYSEVAINPRAVLKNWVPANIQALLNRAIFDVASYKQTRLNHRYYLEYLAAEALFQLFKENLSFRGLLGHLVIVKNGVFVIPESRRAVVGWLCHKIPKLKNVVLENDPALLLEHGDPSNLLLSDRRRLLFALADKPPSGWKQFSDFHLARLADDGLVPDLISLISSTASGPDLKTLFLQLIQAGKLHGCIDSVLNIATDLSCPLTLRIAAL